MSAAALNLEMPPLMRTVAALQRMLLALLLCAHFTLPYLLRFSAGNQLLLDSIMPSQLCILLIALTFADLTWVSVGLLLTASVATAYGWMAVYPTHLHNYALANVAAAFIVLYSTLILLRWRGYRGTWQIETSDVPPPWQVSIRLLMAATAFVAVSCATATWMRGVAAIDVASDSWFVTLLTFVADGFCTSLLCLAAIWAAGTRSAGVAKFVVLLGIAVFIVVFQIYAFRMEAFWHLPTFMSACWILVTCGTLYIWRVCGWRVVSPSPSGFQSHRVSHGRS